MAEDRKFDAIVVGSGFAGAVTACRLSEAGLKVCMLERGRRYTNVDLPILPDETFWPRTDDDHVERKVPDFARAVWQLGQGLWELRDLGELFVAQAAGFGGGSLIYANVHLRAPTEVFAAWPAPYRGGDTLQPYYDLAAQMLDVQQLPEALPKTVGLETAALQREALNDAVATRVFRPPLAVNFGHEGKNRFGAEQGKCDMRGECVFGCAQQAKNTLDLNYLRLAEEGDVEVRTLAEVAKITRVAGASEYEVEYRNHLKRGARESVHAPYVFLCAGAVNTTELLLKARDAGQLPIAGTGLGTKFYPNADELGVIFDCKEEQEIDRGPTITTAWLHDDGKNWVMVQDGGLPTYLGPMLGMFRSPLWLERNAFGAAGTIDPAGRQAALPQRVGYAALPVDSIVDLLTGLTGGAVGASGPLSHEVSRAMVGFARGGREESQPWSLWPKQLSTAIDQLRESTLADLALAAEPLIENLIARTGDRIPDGLIDSARELGFGTFDIGNLREAELRQWALQAGIQAIWGSRAGLLGSVAKEVSSAVAPATNEVVQRATSLLRWALDYRGDDGHATVLLAMGRDAKPSRLELIPTSIPIGSRITVVTGAGDGDGASGILVHRSDEVYVLSHVEGAFRKGDRLVAGTRPIGRCKEVRREELNVGVVKDEAGTPVALCVLSVAPMARDDTRLFRADSYREGERKSAQNYGTSAPQLRASCPSERDTPERNAQELLLRDLARSLGGELRTSPLYPFLGRRITVHAQGGCPMAENAKAGITSASGEVFGCDGLYVMDGAAFPTPVGVNPSATIAAVAEWKVEQFLQAWVERGRSASGDTTTASAWLRERVEMLRAASEWAATRPWLDPIAQLPTRVDSPSAKPESKPVGIEFKEVMTGTQRAWGGGEEFFIETSLTITVEDLALFLAADRANVARELCAEGNVRVVWGKGKPCQEYAVEKKDASIRLRSAVDDDGKQTRTIEYLLEFVVGHERYQLDGIKNIRNDARLDAWEDTTTLCFLLRKRPEADHGRSGDAAPVAWTSDEPCRWGVLRLPAAQFFGLQVPSLKATNVDDPARQVWACVTFASFFFSHLVDVYVPALTRLGDVGKRVIGRGHV